MPLVKVKNKFQVTIPAEIRDKIHLKEGDILEMTVHGVTIILKPKVVIDREFTQKAIAEGLDDYKKGKVIGPFKSVKEFKKSLNNI